MSEDDAEKWSDGMSPGSWVRVKASASSTRMTPNELLRAGWPNGHFQVLGRGLFDLPNVPKKVDCLMLWPCCNFCRNPATGQFLCNAHPAKLFSPVPELYKPEEPESIPASSLGVGLLGRDVVNVSYYKDGNGAFVVRAFGKEAIKVEGKPAQLLDEALKGINLI